MSAKKPIGSRLDFGALALRVCRPMFLLGHVAP
jgi:hypothetical protein